MKKQIHQESSDKELISSPASQCLSSATITPFEEIYQDTLPTHESPPPKIDKNVDVQIKFNNNLETTDKIKDGGPRKRKLIIQRKTFLDK